MVIPLNANRVYANDINLVTANTNATNITSSGRCYNDINIIDNNNNVLTLTRKVGGAGGGNATLSGCACFTPTRYPQTNPTKP